MKPQIIMKTGIAIVLLILLCLAPRALAQGNMVVNGGFDTDASGWSITNIGSGGGFLALFGNPPGSVVLENPSSSNVPTASQEIYGLTPGQLYTVSGDYWRGAIDGVADSGFDVSLDGVSLFNTTVSTTYTWFNFSFDYTANSTSVFLSLSTPINVKGNGYIIDNIAMYAVPEPGSLCLIGVCGIVGALFFRKRKNPLP